MAHQNGENIRGKMGHIWARPSNEIGTSFPNYSKLGGLERFLIGKVRGLPQKVGKLLSKGSYPFKAFGGEKPGACWAH